MTVGLRDQPQKRMMPIPTAIDTATDRIAPRERLEIRSPKAWTAQRAGTALASTGAAPFIYTLF